MIPQWVRIRGFPIKFWQWDEFEKVFSEFGATVLELDPATCFRCDRQVARVRLGMCDPLLLPPIHWVMHRNSGGYMSRFDLIFELEHPRNSGPLAWVKRSQPNDPISGAPSNKGVTISELGVKISEKKTTTPKNPSGSCKGKGKNLTTHRRTSLIMMTISHLWMSEDRLNLYLCRQIQLLFLMVRISPPMRHILERKSAV